MTGSDAHHDTLPNLESTILTPTRAAALALAAYGVFCLIARRPGANTAVGTPIGTSIGLASAILLVGFAAAPVLVVLGGVHSLFDTGYVTVTPNLHFEVSRRIREEFDNGKDYYALHGQRIIVPEPVAQRPDPGTLAWHNEHCFKG